MHEHDPSVVDGLLERQRRAWDEGRRPSVEQALKDAALDGNTEVLLDLLYNEIVLREERGEQPSLDEYLGRYPELGGELALHFEVHSALREGFLEDTYRVEGSASVPDHAGEPRPA